MTSISTGEQRATAVHFRRLGWLAVWLVLASPALAWNAAGHRISAMIAWQQLDEHTRSAVATLLRQHPDFRRWQARGKGAGCGSDRFRRSLDLARRHPPGPAFLQRRQGAGDACIGGLYGHGATAELALRRPAAGSGTPADTVVRTDRSTAGDAGADHSGIARRSSANGCTPCPG
jgi:hypothetical protein